MTENLLENADDQPQHDPNKDYLTELVGEGKKFKDVKSLAEGKFQSDSYIKVLEKRLDEMRGDYLKMREENTARANLQDLVTELRKSQASTETPPANADQPNQPIDVEAIVSTKLQQYELEKKRQENFNLVKDELQKRYGSNYKQTVKNQLDDLGLTEEDLNDMARKQPKALLRTLGLDKPVQQDYSAPPRNQQRRDNFAPTGTKERTWSYYQELRRKDPLAWSDRKTAVQMQEDAIALGDKFYDGNFYVQGLHDK